MRGRQPYRCPSGQNKKPIWSEWIVPAASEWGRLCTSHLCPCETPGTEHMNKTNYGIFWDYIYIHAVALNVNACLENKWHTSWALWIAQVYGRQHHVAQWMHIGLTAFSAVNGTGVRSARPCSSMDDLTAFSTSHPEPNTAKQRDYFALLYLLWKEPVSTYSSDMAWPTKWAHISPVHTLVARLSSLYGIKALYSAPYARVKAPSAGPPVHVKRAVILVKKRGGTVTKNSNYVIDRLVTDLYAYQSPEMTCNYDLCHFSRKNDRR